MSIFASHAEKAKKALADAISQHAIAIAALDAHDLVPAGPGDAEAIKNHRTRRQSLAEDVDIAAGVVTHWHGVSARLDEEAAKKAAADERARIEKEANGPMAALVRKIASDAEKLAAEIAKLEEHRARAAAAGIEDAESKVRKKPGRTVPAEFRDELVWEDGAGNRPSVFRKSAEGELVPQEMGFTRKTVRVQVAPERVIPPAMPPRFAELLPALRKAVGP